MRGFLAGAGLVTVLWAAAGWWRNPHGHRGGERIPGFSLQSVPSGVPSGSVFPAVYLRN